jgi:chemotaxis signal transduction protein
MVGNASWCTFRLGGRLYGIRVERVQEVLKPMPLTPVPLAPAAVRGLLNLRGQIVTALDLAPSLDAIAADSSRCSSCGAAPGRSRCSWKRSGT